MNNYRIFQTHTHIHTHLKYATMQQEEKTGIKYPTWKRVERKACKVSVPHDSICRIRSKTRKLSDWL